MTTIYSLTYCSKVDFELVISIYIIHSISFKLLIYEKHYIITISCFTSTIQVIELKDINCKNIAVASRLFQSGFSKTFRTVN